MLIGPGEWRKIPGYVPADVVAEWAARVLERRDDWTLRDTGWYPAATYGNSWYIDIESGVLHEYHATAPRANALIGELPGYLDAMRAVAEHLAGPDGTVLPTRARRENLGEFWCDSGIHIFGGIEAEGRGDMHADYEGLSPYPGRLFAPDTRAFSAIVSVSTPLDGGGLDIWDERRFLGHEPPPDPDDPAPRIVSVDYAPGDLVVLDSFLFHRIQRFRVDESSFRMTAVMHFLLLDEPYPHWEHWF